jgi:hypothetical protein
MVRILCQLNSKVPVLRIVFQIGRTNTRFGMMKMGFFVSTYGKLHHIRSGPIVSARTFGGRANVENLP